MAIYPTLVVVTPDETLPQALIQPEGARLRPGQTNEIGSEDPVARLLYEGTQDRGADHAPDAYEFAVEIRTEDGIETFAAWLVAKTADRTAMLHLDDRGVEATESAIVDELAEQWRVA